MKNQFSGILRFLLFLILGLFLVWLSFKNINFEEVATGLKEANYLWLLVAIGFSFLAFFSRARRWILLMKPLGYSPGLMNTFHAMLSGYLANIALPRLGEFTKCVALGRKEDIPAKKILGTVIVERAVDLMSLLLLMTLLLFIGGDEIKSFLRENIVEPGQSKVFTLLGFKAIYWAIALFVIIASAITLFIYRHKLGRINIILKFKSFGQDIIAGLKTIARLENRWEFLFHTIFIWVNYLLMTWVIVFAIPATAHLTLGDGLFLLVIGSLAMAAPVQSGFGAFHWIISRGLNVIFGVNLADGMVYATLSHESQILMILVAGTISTIIIYNGKSKKRSEKEG